ncbi:MAG: S8 family serine peptidase, partial [Candidatus Subteraquimicrobiales bacterium]|nr:S8 family serine peptidase [Candidatus Subteraquimicrobiales bacterium]
MKQTFKLKVAGLVLVISLFFVSAGNLTFGFSNSSREILIGFNSSLNDSEIADFCQKYNLKQTGEIKELNLIKTSTSTDEVLSEIKSDLRVEFAEANQTFKATLVPNDPYFSSQWSLARIGLPQAWDAETGRSNSVMVAVLDTGVDATHPDLAGKVIAGYDFINKDPDPSDDDGHGTAVASVIAAATNNSQGIAGTSWGAKIMPLKVLNGAGDSSEYAVSKGIIYAADKGAKVINMSFGGSTYSQTIQSAIDYAGSKGCLLVAAAGNLSNGALPNVFYPAAYDGVLAVSATNQSDLLATWSNYGYFI